MKFRLLQWLLGYIKQRLRQERSFRKLYEEFTDCIRLSLSIDIPQYYLCKRVHNWTTGLANQLISDRLHSYNMEHLQGAIKWHDMVRFSFKAFIHVNPSNILLQDHKVHCMVSPDRSRARSWFTQCCWLSFFQNLRKQRWLKHYELDVIIKFVIWDHRGRNDQQSQPCPLVQENMESSTSNLG